MTRPGTPAVRRTKRAQGGGCVAAAGQSPGFSEASVPSGMVRLTTAFSLRLQSRQTFPAIDLHADHQDDEEMRHQEPGRVQLSLLVALTVTTDLLSAVVLGLLFTAASFIVEYSRHSGVLQRATLQLERSKVLRPAADHAAIDAHGAAVFIVHLHGMIFFGSANSIAAPLAALAVHRGVKDALEDALPTEDAAVLDVIHLSARVKADLVPGSGRERSEPVSRLS